MTDAGCCSCRFTAVAEALVDLREELQKQQEQNKKYDNSLSDPVATMDSFALSLCKTLLSK